MTVERSQSQAPQPFVVDLVRDTIDDDEVERIRRGVEARRAAGGSTRRQRSPFLIPIAAAAGVTLILLLSFFLWSQVTESESQNESPLVAGPLELSNGRALTRVSAAPDAEPRRVELSDGSSMELAPGTTITSIENDGHDVAFEMDEGRATFRVRPGGPRRWSIDAGLARVDVIGTTFTVDRATTTVEVSVEQGRVRVSSQQLDGEPRMLTAGEALIVQAPEVAGIEPEDDVETSAPDQSAPSSGSSTSEAGRQPVPWPRLARDGEFGEAYELLGEEGLQRETQSADSLAQLMTLADVARFSGHPREAVAPLEAAIERHPGDTRAAVAAFTLGRLESDVLRRHGRAARAFRRCLQLRAPAALREDAQARLARSLARSGNYEGARDAAREYLRRYPAGRHIEELRGWIEPR